MVETGGTSLFNFNIGNVKHSASDGLDFVALKGVWEGVTPQQAEQLIASGQATEDPSPDHAAAVGPGRVSVIFQPPHPATLFRAYPDLASGVLGHLQFLKTRFGIAWPALVAGNPDDFARRLKVGGYYTASADAYSRGVVMNFNQYMSGKLPVAASSFLPPATPNGVRSGVQVSAASLALAIAGASVAMLTYQAYASGSLARTFRRNLRTT